MGRCIAQAGDAEEHVDQVDEIAEAVVEGLQDLLPPRLGADAGGLGLVESVEGVADGSLRPDLDPGLTLQAVMNAVIGAQRRLASLGNRVELEYGQPIDRMVRETIRVILLGLRATQEPAAQPGVRSRQGTLKEKRSS